MALVPDLILNAAKHDEVATLPLTPASRRQILAVTTSDLQRVPAVAAALDALCEAAGADPKASPAQLVGSQGLTAAAARRARHGRAATTRHTVASWVTTSASPTCPCPSATTSRRA